jgi:hypothetical protein
MRPLFGQEMMNRQEIAQDTYAAFCGPAALRDRCGRPIAFVDRGEYFQFDGGLDGFSQLIRINGTEEALGSSC